jgi:hypothetical protein
MLFLLSAPLVLTGCGGKENSPDRPENDSVIDGALEVVNGAQIYGWAWDKKRPNRPVRVDIYDGDTLLATVPADEFRQDLLDLGMGNGKHAFDYTTPASLKDGKEHVVRVTAAGTKTDLPGSPQVIVIEFP